MVAAGLLAGGSCAAYFRNASVWFDDQAVAKINLLGMVTTCPRDQLRKVEAAYSPQPTLTFIRKDGSRAFRINTRLWTDEQVQLMSGLASSPSE
jgi:hypothetical protein